MYSFFFFFDDDNWRFEEFEPFKLRFLDHTLFDARLARKCIVETFFLFLVI